MGAIRPSYYSQSLKDYMLLKTRAVESASVLARVELRLGDSAVASAEEEERPASLVHRKSGPFGQILDSFASERVELPRRS